jgi:membrane-bound lytic murein transglycosylase D
MKTPNYLTVPFSLLLATSCSILQLPSSQDATAITSPHAAGHRDPLPLAATAAGFPAPAQAPEGSGPPATINADFWQQLRRGFRLGATQQSSVKQQLRIYSNNAHQVERILMRGEPYLAYIRHAVAQRKLPTEIALLPFVESGYDPFAYSHGRAAGLWQFIPATGKRYGLRQDWWYDGRRDVTASTEAALDYLETLHREFSGDWLLALAAYNSGEGTIRRAISANRRTGKPTDFWHLDLPSETAIYVPRLLAISLIVARPAQYGIELPPMDPEPGFRLVDTRGQIDLGIAAELADMEPEALYRLNPGFNRWATHPDGPHRLAIPVEKAAAFEENLAALPASARAKWVRHRIRKGETLSHIARRYDTTVAVLRSSNAIRGSSIRAGAHLLVPVAAKDPARYAALDAIRQRGPASGSKLVYRVKSGDSLWQIARRHDVRVAQLTVWNRLDSGTIRPGQQLVIWKNGAARANAGTTRSVHYTVRSGDSLYRISRKFSVSISQLREWNDLREGKYLQPGQRLKVYVDVTRQSTTRQS